MRAFVFPGQGSQYVGMGRDLVAAFPCSAEVFDQANRALDHNPAIDKIAFFGPAEELRLTANAQPAMVTSSIATLRALEESGLSADVVAGHSVGEYSALVCAGVLRFEDAVRLVRLRGQLMQTVCVRTGVMAAIISLEPGQVEALCKEVADGEVVVPANYNSSAQTVVSGDRGAVERLSEAAKLRGATAVMLNVSGAFHSPLMQPAQDRLASALSDIEFGTPRVPVICNVEAEPITDPARFPELLARQITAPVRWYETVLKLKAMGVTEVVEVGPKKVLSRLVQTVAPDMRIRSFDGPVEIEQLAWDRDNDRKVNRVTGKIMWDDGLQWDPGEPGAFGF